MACSSYLEVIAELLGNVSQVHGRPNHVHVVLFHRVKGLSEFERCSHQLRALNERFARDEHGHYVFLQLGQLEGRCLGLLQDTLGEGEGHLVRLGLGGGLGRLVTTSE